MIPDHPERTIGWDDDHKRVWMIDQTRLPGEYTTYVAETVDELIECIQQLRVRGAPAIGAAGAFGVALSTHTHGTTSWTGFLDAVERDASAIASARPTAVNLAAAVEAVFDSVAGSSSIEQAQTAAVGHATAIADADIECNRSIGSHGASLLDDGEVVLTHCNAGALATVGWGTALGVVYSAHEAGKEVEVLTTETRPLNQGSRITTVELRERNVPRTLIADSAVGHCMRTGDIDAVIIGADRIVPASNERENSTGVVYNKIGTYAIAALANRHEIPFYVAAPRSTIDTERNPEDIEIETRDGDELRRIGDTILAPADVPVYNPAFDATPLELVDAVITETGCYRPPLPKEAIAGGQPYADL